jgi:hypothetical protein
VTPDALTGYFLYLDKLQKLGIITDMQAAAFFLEARFLLGGPEAESILQAWRETQVTVTMENTAETGTPLLHVMA